METTLRVGRVATLMGIVGYGVGSLFVLLTSVRSLHRIFYTDPIYRLFETRAFYGVADMFFGCAILVGVATAIGIGWLSPTVGRMRPRAALGVVLGLAAIPVAECVLRTPAAALTAGLLTRYFVLGPVLVGAVLAISLVVSTRRWYWTESALVILGSPIVFLVGRSYPIIFGYLLACVGSWVTRATLSTPAAEQADQPGRAQPA
jgi:hypothetical protein